MSARRPEPFRETLRRAGITLPLPARGRAIVVNIPGFELIALEDGVPVLRSRVVVGALATPTPVMRTRLVALEYWPSWRPSRGMIDRGEYPASEIAPPGPDNPLGPLVLWLDNNQEILMHATNAPARFDDAVPAASHGCIWVERYQDLAAWATGQDREHLAARLEQVRTRWQRVRPIPVWLVYFTHFPTATGEIAEYPDIYGREHPPAGETPPAGPQSLAHDDSPASMPPSAPAAPPAAAPAAEPPPAAEAEHPAEPAAQSPDGAALVPAAPEVERHAADEQILHSAPAP